MKIETLSIIVKDWRKLRAELKKELTKDKQIKNIKKQDKGQMREYEEQKIIDAREIENKTNT